MSTWNHAWIVLILIFAGGLIVGKLSEKPRIPDVAAYLVYGILIGPSVLNWVHEPSQSQVNQFVLNLGATLILFDGGRGVQLSVLRQVWISVTMLATIGVFVTAAVVGIVTHFVLKSPWLFSLLVGSVIASTDPATLIPVFKRVTVLSRLRQTVESESAFNDATGSVLTFALIAASASGSGIDWGTSALNFAQSAAVGLIVGFIFGMLSLFLVSKKAWGVFHEFGSIVFLVMALSSYETATLFHASGFMAAFTAGVIAGNAPTFGLEFVTHTNENIEHFGNAITLIMRMSIFVLLGTQVDFALVGHYWLQGLIIILVFMLLARPLAVFSSVLVDKLARWHKSEVAFMCWVRETGVIPAALSGMLIAKGYPHADIIGAITFMAILLTIVIQASTTDFVAKRLGVLEGDGLIEEI